MQRRITITTPTNTQLPITIDYSKKLGKGGYGTVYAGEDSSSHQMLAAKVIITIYPDDHAACISEIEIMQSLTSPMVRNIVQLYGHAANVGSNVIAMTYASNGSLLEWLSGIRQPQLQFKQQVKIMHGVAFGLAYMHHLNCIHCDIKPGNVLLDDQMEPLICDFGGSKRIGVDDFNIISGTERFFSPEILLGLYRCKGVHQTKASDMYSFALLCWCVISQTAMPFQEVKTLEQLCQHVGITNGREVIPSEPQCPANIAELISRAWGWHPAKRPSAKQAVAILSDQMEPAVVSALTDATQPAEVVEAVQSSSQSSMFNGIANFFSQLTLALAPANMDQHKVSVYCK